MQPHYTHANEKRIISRESSLWIISWLLPENRGKGNIKRAGSEQFFSFQMACWSRLRIMKQVQVVTPAHSNTPMTQEGCVCSGSTILVDLGLISLVSRHCQLQVPLSPLTCHKRWAASKATTLRPHRWLRLTSSSWWRSRRRWRGRSRPAAGTSAWGRCQCLLQTQSAHLAWPSTVRTRPEGRARVKEWKHDEVFQNVCTVGADRTFCIIMCVSALHANVQLYADDSTFTKICGSQMCLQRFPFRHTSDCRDLPSMCMLQCTLFWCCLCAC